MDTVTQIEKLKRQIASLEKKAARDEQKRRKNLLRKVTRFAKAQGYTRLEEMLAYIQQMAGKKPTKAARRSKARKRRRMVITGALRKSIVAELKKGRTVAQLVNKTGVSSSSINNIKRMAGLVRSTKVRKTGKSSKPVVTKAAKVELPGAVAAS